MKKLLLLAALLLVTGCATTGTSSDWQGYETHDDACRSVSVSPCKGK